MSSMKKRRSLADELAELANPKPVQDVDPDAFDFLNDRPGSLLDVDDEDAGMQAKRSARKKSGLLRRGDIALDSGAYAGRVRSRQEMQEEDEASVPPLKSGGDLDGGGAESPSEEDEDEGGTSSDDAEEDSDDDKQKSKKWPTRGKSGGGSGGKKRVSDSPSDESESDEDDDDESSDDDGAAKRNDEDDAVDDLERSYRQLQRGSEDSAAALKARETLDMQKGRAVRHQKILWDRFLEFRIFLQRILGPANRLPQPDAYGSYCRSSPECAAAFTALRYSAATTLDSLLSLHRALVDQNSAISEAAGAARAKAGAGGAGAKPAQENSSRSAANGAVTGNGGADASTQSLANNRSDSSLGGARPAGAEGSSATTDEYWAAMEEEFGRTQAFRDSALDRWQRKTSLASGATLGKGGLRAVNQSLSSQVAAMMRDAPQLVKRARLRVSEAENVFGKRHAVSLSSAGTAGVSPLEGRVGAESGHADADGRDVHGGGLSSAAARDGRSDGRNAGRGGGDNGNGDGTGGDRWAEDEVDEETFDDSQFYQGLLKELIQSGSLGAEGLSLRKVRSKQRKNVDRRASKGRKARYTVWEPLCNFMAPEPKEYPAMFDVLVSNLFGGAS